MKVLHVIASLDPRGGGPMEGVRQLARASSEWGEQTTVASLDAPSEPFLKGNPFEVVPLGPGSLKYGYSPRLVPWLKAHARDFDAVIVNGLWQYCSFAVWRALRGSPVPYFVFTHGMLDPYFKRAYPMKHLKKWLYWPWADYRVLRDARAVFFTCEEERLLARQSFWLYRCKEVVAGFGTAPPPVARVEAIAAFIRTFPELAGRRLLVFLGRIHEKKGCDMLIEAFAEAAATDPRWHLVMAGPCDDALGRRLRSQADTQGISDRITWTGMISGEVKWGALYAADAFVLPSHQENFGIAVVEALACGTPVLISVKVNIWREIDQDEAGFAAPDTVEGTGQLLRYWQALDEKERHHMRAAARRCFDARFDMRAVARNLTDQISHLACSQ